MKAAQNKLSNRGFLSLFLTMVLSLGLNFNVQADCPNTPILDNLPWLDAEIDSIETIGCQQSCYDFSGIYCTGNPNEGLIFTIEPNLNCSDVPTIYYDELGNYICSSGSFAGSDCDSSFIENLIFLDEYWSCSDSGNSCNNFSSQIIMNGPSTICEGESVTLIANPSGGTPPYTYFWNNNQTASSIVVSPIGISVYTLNTIDANGCQSNFSFTINAENCDSTDNCESLSVVINSDNQNTCLGDSITLTALVTGGTPGYTYDWGNPAIPPMGFPSTITVLPTGITTYTVSVTDFGGCMASDIIVLSPDTCDTDTTTNCNDFSIEIISNSNDSVCIGESITLNTQITGGTPGFSYNWNTGATTSSITVSPTPNNSNYIVWTNDANGCAAIDTFDIIVTDCEPDTNIVCTDSVNCVFPGDGNKSYAVNNYDILNIGFGFNKTGPVRNQVSIAPQYFSAADWSNNGINNINLKHADCNGDGLINQADIQAIEQNYDESAVFNEITSGNNQDITVNVEFNSDTIFIEPNPNDTSNVFTIEADLILNQGIVKAAISGLAFQINVDNIDGTLLDAFVQFEDGTWLTANNNAISFNKFIADQNRIDVAVSRTDQIPVTGSGRIGKVYMIIEDNIIGRIQSDALTYSVSIENLVAVGDAGQSILAAGETSDVVLAAPDVSTGISNNLEGKIKIYPNPVSSVLTIETVENIQIIQLFNLDGKLIRTELNSTNVDMSELPNNQYILKIITKEGVLVKSIIKVR